MGNDRSSDVVERVADVLARLGGDPRGARPRTGGSSADDTGSESGPSTAASAEDDPDPTTLTDGGADGAPPGGDTPWIEDDPIVFGDEADAEQESALLDAVTESDAGSAPPFGDGDAVEADAAAADTDEDGDTEPAATGADETEDGDVAALDPERLDELEARIEALESDHVHLDATVTDAAAAIGDLQTDVDRLGDDVRRLVSLLGGVAIANAASEPPATTGATATAVGDEGDAAAASENAGAAEKNRVPEGGRADEADDGAAETADDDAGTADGDAEAASEEATREASTEEQTAELPDGAPDGIHRGAGEPPEPAADGAALDDEPQDATTDPIDDGGHAGADAADGVAESGAVAAAPAAAPAAGRSEEPARELVDPRTEAVGARLRQFREGFVDDPTADLPTGDAADEFRFDKILLPTDGEAAPDLSAGELAKPYLETLPDGYAADAVVLEWLDWLVSAADAEVAAQAIAYYESVEWLTAEVRDDLLGYLDGLGGSGSTAGDRGTDPETAPDGSSVTEPPAALDVQDHLRSLQYVTELASGEVGSDGV